MKGCEQASLTRRGGMLFLSFNCGESNEAMTFQWNCDRIVSLREEVELLARRNHMCQGCYLMLHRKLMAYGSTVAEATRNRIACYFANSDEVRNF